MRESRTKLQLIVSRIDGVLGRVGPGEVIRLEDGTAWKLANKDEHYGGHADHPAVAIYKAIFGWKMRVSRIAEFYVLRQVSGSLGLVRERRLLSRQAL